MRRTNENNVTMKLSNAHNTKIKIMPHDDENILVSITSNVNGFKTIIMLPIAEAKKFHMFLCEHIAVNNSFESLRINALRIKHREYTKTQEEENFSMKYFNTSRGTIKVSCVDGCTVIHIGTYDKTFTQFCIETYEFVRIINDNKSKIVNMCGEHMMNNWN